MEKLIIALIAIIAVYVICRIIRFKSFLGSLFGAEIRSTTGEIRAAPSGPVKVKIRVHKLDPAGVSERNVGIELVAKSILSYQLMPAAVSVTEAKSLIELLQKAVSDS